MVSTGGSQRFMIYEKMHRILPLRRQYCLSPKQHTTSSWSNRGESFAVAIAVFILNLPDFQTIQNEQGIVTDCVLWTMVGWWAWVWANSGRQWRPGKPGVRQFMVLQRIHDLATEEQHGKKRIIQSFNKISNNVSSWFRSLDSHPILSRTELVRELTPQWYLMWPRGQVWEVRKPGSNPTSACY